MVLSNVDAHATGSQFGKVWNFLARQLVGKGIIAGKSSFVWQGRREDMPIKINSMSATPIEKTNSPAMME